MKQPSRLLRACVLAGAICLLLPVSAPGWSGDVHRLLNRSATRHFPPVFQPFADWVEYLEVLATAADERKCCVPGERIKHYIDIDDYAEFFSGTLPHPWPEMVATYGASRVEDNGILPWAIEDSYDALVGRFRVGDWDGAVNVAADIGHYVGDLHNPLHLTLNFDGQLTGQHGIHSRYESEMTGRHLNELEPASDLAAHLDSPLESVFDWIDVQYQGVEMVLAADLTAVEAAGNDWSSTYYNVLWDEIGTETKAWVASASVAIASIWYTAWVDAGSPPLPGSVPVQPTTWGRLKTLYGR